MYKIRCPFIWQCPKPFVSLMLTNTLYNMKSKLKELRAEAQELIDLGDSHEKREGYGMLKVIDAFTDTEDYFKIQSNGYNHELQREEIQIHCGENGNLMLVKTDEGFVVDVYGQNDIVGTMAIWEDQLVPDVYTEEDTEEEKKWIRMADDSEDGDCDELCPHCDTEVKLKNVFEVQECPSCKAPILPCSICTHGSDEGHTKPCSCDTCPLEANVREQYIDKIMDKDYGTDDPKYDASNRHYLEKLSTMELSNMFDALD